MFKNLDQIHYIAANYSRLQGLRGVPVGIFIGLAGIWSSLPVGQDGDLIVPFIMVVAVVLAYIYVDRYYARVFGQVSPTGKARNREILVSILMGIFVFFAFLFDTAKVLPISTFGLAFGVALTVDFFRVAGKNSISNSPESVVGPILIVISSLAPLAGIFWWKVFGLQTSQAGILVLIGILLTISGIISHLRFTRLLAKIQETGNA